MPNETERRRENLAICFQDVLTTVVRLRTDVHTVTNGEPFRANAVATISAAEQAAARVGYLAEDARLATFAGVALLDESILNSRNPAFETWARRPLQEELFGVHVAGEIFFRNLERLLAQPNSQDLADVLEVYQLCLRLGFRGKYGMGTGSETRTLADSVGVKIKQIRGERGELSPSWQPSGQAIARPPDSPWTRRLIVVAAACGGLALLLFGVFKVTLGSGLGN